MKRLTRILCFVPAFFSLLYLIRFPTGRAGRLQNLTGRKPAIQAVGKAISGLMFIAIEIPKLLASAASPFLAVAGAAGSLLAALRHDPTALLAGLIGVFLSVRHVRRVTAPSTGFEEAFGVNWPALIPPELGKRLSPNRWRFPAGQAVDQEVVRSRDVLYGIRPDHGAQLLCDIWQPVDPARRTGLAVLFLHGGAWQALDKGIVMQPLFRRLAGQGHVIVDVAYTLAPQTNLDGMLHDVKRAIAWVKSNASIYGIRPDRVVLMGVSGGGHLALLAAYTPNQPDFQPKGLHADTSVCAVIASYAPTDLVAHAGEYRRMGSGQPDYRSQITPEMLPRHHDRTVLDRLLTRLRLFPVYRHKNGPGGPLLLIQLVGGSLNENPEAYLLASPLSHVRPDCPPTLQIFGAHDFYFSPSHGRRLHRALRERGVPSVYVELPETGHGFDLFLPVSPAAQAAAYDIEHFLALCVSNDQT